MTDNAANIIVKMLAKNGMPQGGLRIGIKAGGCSGLSYQFGWEQAPRETDEVFEGPQGARIFIDPKSHQYLDGTVLDFDTGLVSRGFVFNNPNATATCGCGTSFAVTRG